MEISLKQITLKRIIGYSLIALIASVVLGSFYAVVRAYNMEVADVITFLPVFAIGMVIITIVCLFISGIMVKFWEMIKWLIK